MEANRPRLLILLHRFTSVSAEVASPIVSAGPNDFQIALLLLAVFTPPVFHLLPFLVRWKYSRSLVYLRASPINSSGTGLSVVTEAFP